MNNASVVEYYKQSVKYCKRLRISFINFTDHLPLNFSNHLLFYWLFLNLADHLLILLVISNYIDHPLILLIIY